MKQCLLVQHIAFTKGRCEMLQMFVIFIALHDTLCMVFSLSCLKTAALHLVAHEVHKW